MALSIRHFEMVRRSCEATQYCFNHRTPPYIVLEVWDTRSQVQFADMNSRNSDDAQVDTIQRGNENCTYPNTNLGLITTIFTVNGSWRSTRITRRELCASATGLSDIVIAFVLQACF